MAGLSLSIFGYGNGYTKPQPPVVVILPPPSNFSACRGTKKKKKKKTIKKKKKLYPTENNATRTRSQAPPWLPKGYDSYRQPRPSLPADTYYEASGEMCSYATATEANGNMNNTSTYCRRTRQQVYESEEEEEEEESESDDESEESDDDEEEDESDEEETVHQLPARRGRGSPEEHLRYHRAYY